MEFNMSQPESPESPEYKMIAHAALAAAGVIFSVIVALGFLYWKPY